MTLTLPTRPLRGVGALSVERPCCERTRTSGKRMSKRVSERALLPHFQHRLATRPNCEEEETRSDQKSARAVAGFCCCSLSCSFALLALRSRGSARFASVVSRRELIFGLGLWCLFLALAGRCNRVNRCWWYAHGVRWMGRRPHWMCVVAQHRGAQMDGRTW